MRSWLTALAFAILFFCCTCAGPAKIESSETTTIEEKPVAPLTLTGNRVTGSFRVTPETLASRPVAVELQISKVLNPAGAPLSVFVYLSRGGKKAQSDGQRIPIGSFSLYPPDQPGKFMLRASTALSKLGPGRDDVQLVIELKRVDETKPWTNVELTVEPPKWLRDEPR